MWGQPSHFVAFFGCSECDLRVFENLPVLRGEEIRRHGVYFLRLVQRFSDFRFHVFIKVDHRDPFWHCRIEGKLEWKPKQFMKSKSIPHLYRPILAV